MQSGRTASARWAAGHGVVAMIAVVALGCRRGDAAAAVAPSPGAHVAADAGPTPPPVDDPDWRVFTPSADAPPRQPPPDGTLRLTSTAFLIPLPLVDQRLHDVDGMVALLRGTEAGLAAYDAAHPGALGARVYVWYAAKPGRRVRAWVTGEPMPAAALAATLADAIARGPGPEVDDLVLWMVTFARREEAAAAEPSLPPAPPAWRAAGPAPLDQVVLTLWPD